MPIAIQELRKPRAPFERIEKLFAPDGPKMDRHALEIAVNSYLMSSGLTEIFRLGDISIVPTEQINEQGVRISYPKDKPDIVIFQYALREPEKPEVSQT